MLTPAVAAKVAQFYAIGNTPATSLARWIPQSEDVDANILSLGCGDVRNILYTAFCEQDRRGWYLYSPDSCVSVTDSWISHTAPRKLDFTCCDIEEGIHARNLVLFSFLIDDELADDQLELLWDVYYHMYLEDDASVFLRDQITELLAVSKTLDDWTASVYGSTLRFCDAATFRDFRRLLAKYNDALSSTAPENYRKSFKDSLAMTQRLKEERFGKGQSIILTGVRSAAPLSLQAVTDLPQVFQHYWDTGTTATKVDKSFPNPLFAASMTQNVFLHYGTDPILGFHVATAYAKLTENSPLRVENDDKVSGAHKVVKAAKIQFFAWARAFQAIKDRIVIRVVTADALAFCHTLQHRLSSGPTRLTGQWFRRQLDVTRIELNAKDYGIKESDAIASGLTVPLKFDLIDTSNLADHLGTLNLLLAAAPLMSNKPYSTIQTELLIRQDANEKDTFDRVLGGHTTTIAMLLGISPVEYYTNATVASSVDEIMINQIGPVLRGEEGVTGNTQLRSRVAWKLAHHFSSQARFQLPVTISAEDLTSVLMHAYREMLSHEDTSLSTSHHSAAERMMAKGAYPHYHRGSLAALMKAIEHRCSTDWPAVCRALINKMHGDRGVHPGSNFSQDFAAHLHIYGVHSESWLKHDIERENRTAGGASAWKQIPEVVAVTLVVPRSKLNRLFGGVGSTNASPTLQAVVRSSDNAADQWHNVFTDVQLLFGRVTPRGQREDPEFRLRVEEDPEGWQGESPLLLCFYAPTCGLQIEPRTARIGLQVQPSMQSVMVYGDILGSEMLIDETALGDESRLFITRFIPGTEGYPSVCAPLTHLAGRGQKKFGPGNILLTANVGDGSGIISSITGRVNIHEPEEKALLHDKTVPITLRQESGPFEIAVVFGKGKAVHHVHFPVAVLLAGARTRIARTSCYVEVIAPVAPSPASSSSTTAIANPLENFMFPATLDLHRRVIPLTLPNLNLSTLPILSTTQSTSISFLTTLASFMFTPTEKLIRESARSSASGIAEKNPRLNFKESLFSAFMLSSGLQGDMQTGLFAISHPGRGGVHILLAVSALRLDFANGTVVLDAAAIPFTLPMLTVQTPETEGLRKFLMDCQELAMANLSVDDAELALWRSALPVFAERCREWEHGEGCEYREEGATVPVSKEFGERVLCSCGEGKGLEGFIAVPSWEKAKRFATRVVINPTFAVPFVEDLVDLEEVRSGRGKGKKKEDESVEGRMGKVSLGVAACRGCGTPAEEVELRKCTGCKRVAYCSGECQKGDWKRHKVECKAAAS